jgi:hypothetical protein
VSGPEGQHKKKKQQSGPVATHKCKLVAFFEKMKWLSFLAKQDCFFSVAKG